MECVCFFKSIFMTAEYLPVVLNKSQATWENLFFSVQLTSLYLTTVISTLPSLINLCEVIRDTCGTPGDLGIGHHMEPVGSPGFNCISNWSWGLEQVTYSLASVP